VKGLNDGVRDCGGGCSVQGGRSDRLIINPQESPFVTSRKGVTQEANPNTNQVSQKGSAEKATETTSFFAVFVPIDQQEKARQTAN
jgi:hypothetical protein